MKNIILKKSLLTLGIAISCSYFLKAGEVSALTQESAQKAFEYLLEREKRNGGENQYMKLKEYGEVVGALELFMKDFNHTVNASSISRSLFTPFFDENIDLLLQLEEDSNLPLVDIITYSDIVKSLPDDVEIVKKKLPSFFSSYMENNRNFGIDRNIIAFYCPDMVMSIQSKDQKRPLKKESIIEFQSSEGLRLHTLCVNSDYEDIEKFREFKELFGKLFPGQSGSEGEFSQDSQEMRISDSIFKAYGQKKYVSNILKFEEKRKIPVFKISVVKAMEKKIGNQSFLPSVLKKFLTDAPNNEMDASIVVSLYGPAKREFDLRKRKEEEKKLELEEMKKMQMLNDQYYRDGCVL